MMKIADKIYSDDGVAIKYVQSVGGYYIETLYVNYHNKHIICLSSQIGCSVGCKICYTGLFSKLYKNLTALEIFEQCKNVIDERRIGNDKPILFSCMGIGEPLLNYDNVIEAFKFLDKAYPSQKFAMATTGVSLDKLVKLADDLSFLSNFKLTISLHSANEKLRKELIPCAASLNGLLAAVNLYKEKSGKEVEWNYVLLDGINDNIDDAKLLVNFLGNKEYIKINQYNSIEGGPFAASAKDRAERFFQIMEDSKIQYEYYQTNGSDILGACGQMSAKKFLK